MLARTRHVFLAAATLLTLSGCSSPTVEPVSFELAVTAAAPAEPQTFEAPLGAQVTITVLSDVSDELHLHGYELEATLQPGDEETLEFEATMSGSFELETHSTQTVWAKLVVR